MANLKNLRPSILDFARPAQLALILEIRAHRRQTVITKAKKKAVEAKKKKVLRLDESMSSLSDKDLKQLYERLKERKKAK